MKFGSLDLNPTENPAVLDTATWDPAAAWQALQLVNYDWPAIRKAILEGRDFASNLPCQLYKGSMVSKEHSAFLLAGLPDGQQVFLEIGPANGPHLPGEPLGQIQLNEKEQLVAYPTHAREVDRFCRLIHPAKGSRVMGATPRLGIGTRMTT
ncbi:MAG TPA: hypothetical protein VKA67_13400, partial [Verrucomicrobiae bacterium]|nr:hypothetical protein [Verrucomicrobiae bacterium]